MKLFLCGDVMTGRGIDQILPAPCDPALDEPWVKDARDYVALAERRNGAIRRPVQPPYVWGEALAELARERPEARIANLETAVTTSDDREPKGINYRMNPANVGCLLAARLDCCVLANNHVLDWGAKGLEETLATLRRAGIATAGAGRDAAEAEAPAAIAREGGRRLLVFAYAHESAGVPPHWAASADRPGIARLPDLSANTADAIAARIAAARRPGDRAIVSLHWGPNWGWRIARERRDFARRLIDAGAVELVHGHSSHHPGPFEIYRGRLILYSCGDLINDYEGISGHEAFRPELALMYFPTLEEPGGRLLALEMTPMRMRRLRLERANAEEAEWLARTLARESGVPISRLPDGRLIARL
ncbi:MAG: CapA family protein [Burkholderiales bacterium]|nr:CapA family protein [Burkholderiales bacterium]